MSVLGLLVGRLVFSSRSACWKWVILSSTSPLCNNACNTSCIYVYMYIHVYAASCTCNDLSSHCMYLDMYLDIKLYLSIDALQFHMITLRYQLSPVFNNDLPCFVQESKGLHVVESGHCC